MRPINALAVQRPKVSWIVEYLLWNLFDGIYRVQANNLSEEEIT